MWFILVIHTVRSIHRKSHQNIQAHSGYTIKHDLLHTIESSKIRTTNQLQLQLHHKRVRLIKWWRKITWNNRISNKLHLYHASDSQFLTSVCFCCAHVLPIVFIRILFYLIFYYSCCQLNTLFASIINFRHQYTHIYKYTSLIVSIELFDLYGSAYNYNLQPFHYTNNNDDMRYVFICIEF